MSLTKPSTSTSAATATSGPTEAGSSSSDLPMVVRVSLNTMKQSLQAMRKSLVKQRRNELAAAARVRKSGQDSSGQEKMARQTLGHIRKIDARLGLLDEAINQKSTDFTVDLRDPGLRELGFGMDSNGNYPAL